MRNWITCPLNADIFLLEAELFSHGNPDLLSDEINPCQLFCDGMLDLDAGIDFHEVKVLILIEQKLDCAGRVVFGSS